MTKGKLLLLFADKRVTQRTGHFLFISKNNGHNIVLMSGVTLGIGE